MSGKKVGISSMGIHFPSLFISVEELAHLRGVDPNKYLIGLGCKKIALCPNGYTVIDLAVEAARRALARWDGDKNDIGLLAVGTESAIDMSRPFSAFVADRLGLQGNIRSYEVKHACYGGTVALRQATEWKLANPKQNKAALVIAADIALYKPGNPGEPTEGAGAIAMIIDKPDIAEIDPISYPWSKPVFDFWRPYNEQFPLVDGELSLSCYKEAARECYKALLEDKNISFDQLFKYYHALCFHLPFPNMIKKAFTELCKTQGWSDKQIERAYQKKVEPTMEWNKQTGNSYTASLWISVANTLCGLKSGKHVSAFSYGSGCGAELLSLTSGPLAQQGLWKEDVEADLRNRREINAKAYEKMRKEGMLRYISEQRAH